MKKATTDTETPDVVTIVAPPPSKPWYKRKKVVIDIAVIVIVLLFIGGVWLWGNSHKKKPDVGPQYTGQALVDQVNKKFATHDYNGAITLLKNQKIFKEKSTQLLLANAYANKGDYTSALKVYTDLDKAGGLSTGETVTAAVFAERAGDKQTALNLYRSVVSKLQANKDAANNDTLPMYQAKVTELEKATK
jgi:tetratricopeptide (TPR) repeat protein